MLFVNCIAPFRLERHVLANDSLPTTKGEARTKDGLPSSPASPEASMAGGGARDSPRRRSPARRRGSRGPSGSWPSASAGSTTTSLDSPQSSRRPRPRPREVSDDHDDDPTARHYAHLRRAARARLPGVHGPRPLWRRGGAQLAIRCRATRSSSTCAPAAISDGRRSLQPIEVRQWLPEHLASPSEQGWLESFTKLDAALAA